MRPCSLVSEMLRWANSFPELGNHDGSRYSHFAAMNGVPIVYPLPSLVDQAKNELSTQSNKRNGEGFSATWFADGENKFLNGGKA